MNEPSLDSGKALSTPDTTVEVVASICHTPTAESASDTRPDWVKNQECVQEIMRTFKPMPNKLSDRPKTPPVVKPASPEQPAQQVFKARAGSNTKFMPGNNANPSGRPKGSKNKLRQELIDNVGGILDVMIAKALEGDAAAAALVVNRVLPTLRPQSEMVQFVLNVDQPVSKQVAQVLTAISNGEVAPDVGKKIMEAISTLAQVRAVEELAQRIEALEAKQI